MNPVEASTALRLELDPAWKAGMDWKLDRFLELAFPRVHALLDWSASWESLDTELQKVAPQHQQGSLTVDRLYKVRLRNGREAALFLHLEVQAQRDGAFERRMWTYNYRLCDRFGEDVASLAVLLDEEPGWRPQEYRYEFGGCERLFRFPVFKLLDCARPEQEFERHGNPFGLLLAATQVALRTRRDMEGRCAERLRLVKHLYRQGLQRADVVTLMRLLERVTRLPEEMELKFREELVAYEQKEKPMTIETLLSPYEELMVERAHKEGREEGREEGLDEGQMLSLRRSVLDALEVRFGSSPVGVPGKLDAMRDGAKLRDALRLAIKAGSLAEFEAALGN